jgi:hypothetical protein
MATYRPSFVDVSGLSRGISRGLEIAAQRKQQQDLIAEQTTNDFLKSYQPGKLRQMDIPDFTKAYNQYKQTALMYSRMNRGGAPSEQLAASKAQLDNALSGLNDIYSRSTQAASLQKEYADYIKTARLKGYDVPTEISEIVTSLNTSPIAGVDTSKIPSAYSFPLVPAEIDFDGISKTLDLSDARVKDIETVREKVPVRRDVNGNVLYGEQVTKMVGRDPQTTVDMLSRLGRSNARLSNSAKEDYSILAEGIQNNAPESIRRFNEIRQYFPNVTSMKDVTPEMVFGLTFYRKKPQATTIDRGAADDEYQRRKDIISIQRQGEKAAGTKAGEVSESHPSVIIRSVMEEIPAVTGERGKERTFAGVDVTRQFAGFDMKGGENKMYPIKNVKYIAGGEGTDIQPYFDVTLQDESNFKLQPNAFNTRIVAAMPDITFKSGAVSIPKVSNVKPKAKTPAKTTTPSKGKGVGSLGLEF